MVEKKDTTIENIPALTRKILSEHLNIPGDQIEDNAHLINDFGIDSLKGVEISIDLEEAVGFEIPDNHLERLYTFKNIVDYLQKQLKIEKEKLQR